MSQCMNEIVHCALVVFQVPGDFADAKRSFRAGKKIQHTKTLVQGRHPLAFSLVHYTCRSFSQEIDQGQKKPGLFPSVFPSPGS